MFNIHLENKVYSLTLTQRSIEGLLCSSIGPLPHILGFKELNKKCPVASFKNIFKIGEYLFMLITII